MTSGQPSRGQPTDRRLIITVLASLGLHVAVVTSILWFLRGGPPPLVPPDDQATVELVMEEHKGDLAPSAAPPPSRAAPPETAAQTKPIPETPPDSEPGELPAAAPEAAPEAKTATPEQPPMPAARSQPAEQEAPVISLSGTDSPSDARAFGDRIIPAAPDAVFHNKPPEYPDDAAMAGEYGIVVLLIHVAPSGRVAAVDVVNSSGYVRLDSSARDAVMRWRFLPAVKDGHPIGSEMTMRFDFLRN